MKSVHSALDAKKHNLFTSLLLHLVPGIPIVIAYVAMVPFLLSLGYYPQTALSISFLVFGVPIPILILYMTYGKKWPKNLGYSSKIKWWEYIVYSLLAIFFAVLLSSIVSNYLDLTNLFGSFLPEWFLNPNRHSGVQPNEVAITLWIVLLVDGILHPVVEEIYFRGYLMPKLDQKWWTPIIASLFFALFHLWSPQRMLIIFVISIPWMAIIYWKKNYKLSILIHCLANSIGASIELINHN